MSTKTAKTNDQETTVATRNMDTFAWNFPKYVEILNIVLISIFLRIWYQVDSTPLQISDCIITTILSSKLIHLCNAELYHFSWLYNIQHYFNNEIEKWQMETDFVIENERKW